MKHTSNLLALLCFVMMACNSNTILKKPKNLIPKEKMATILADTYIAKTARNSKNLNGDRSINYLSYIYQNHQTDSTTFHNSLAYYSANVSEHEEILKKVEARLSFQIDSIRDLINKDTLPASPKSNHFNETGSDFERLETLE
ncbi:DUF4296 domain-containing protein [Ochrovirga pacifica]|uniref:DUF4296 domain-containing protein n=1 Tax=Ochrovirga pacifica TaxID=1042376 RepID=UPI000255980D|nr:DUF4296 domain-containing protein [Ochrovirga pacifica]